MSEDEYMKPQYCLSCSFKHSRDLEHHLEDLQTGTKDDPQMREKARELIDQARDLRRKIDDLRIQEEVAKQRLNRTI